MTAKTQYISLKTLGEGSIIDLTSKVAEIVEKSKIKEGTATVFCVGSTGAISTIEYEPGLQKDLPKILDKIAPSDFPYSHHTTWNDNNGRSHVRATLIGPSLTVPITSGKLVLGQWQQIVFIELDTRGRDRQIAVQITGE
ncbi:Uncharacterised protein [uncultured archaeon]|nr:Uncharacterised protein [uncultured archaeon]